jgi:hypothetical protein
MSESDIHFSEVNDPNWKYQKIQSNPVPPVRSTGTPTPHPLAFGADLHVYPDTPIKVVKDGNYTWVTIGLYPGKLTLHLNGSAGENFLFAMEGYKIVKDTGN